MTDPDTRVTKTEGGDLRPCVNAIANGRGLMNFLVRGIPKCPLVLTLHAAARDAMRAIGLLGRAGT